MLDVGDLLRHLVAPRAELLHLGYEATALLLQCDRRDENDAATVVSPSCTGLARTTMSSGTRTVSRVSHRGSRPIAGRDVAPMPESPEPTIRNDLSPA